MSFEEYKRQYSELSVSLSEKCSTADPLDRENTKQKVSKLKAVIDEAETLIQKMDLDARSLQPNVKVVLLENLREYKAELNNLKGEITRISSAYSNSVAREDLLESGLADSPTASPDQETRLMMSTDRLNQSRGGINEGQITMVDSEDLAVSVLEELNSQKQPLLHGHNTLHGDDENIEKSGRALYSISRRMNRYKWIVGSIFILLMIGIILIVYFELSK